ncbi:uncharacterized protein NFIA_023650 [Aspergillus fischeri NRRL 181]|uniref:Uncharacterized protein n=1 Tax=Neosartorya fischeri (strain ATCC 1020 / DSM 3700 / CBS 544.65 / FGSC A1164 / JCM 1740 / NRRL 181 / WB 181) TaxID=331117 RepID=A1D5G1_NEOFI|nr:uncharacterized protein NFIA_023650 [Aspergillus fischeri NRRL 181]EAW23654.1 hypothetical protein NFIA_023650 [Aspergillus fischeri NRRL 181]
MTDRDQLTGSIYQEYAKLIEPNGDGHYLYKPQPFSKLQPGAIGYFDSHGKWNLITDTSVPGDPESKGSTGLDQPLQLIDEGFEHPYTQLLEEWVKETAKALVSSVHGADIKEYGLWAIQKTWSTQECAIAMPSAHSRDSSAGLALAATGVGKIGGSGSSLAKANIEGWSTYKADEDDIAYVVSYFAPIYRLPTIQVLRKSPLKKVQERTADSNEYCKFVYNDNGNQTGVEYYRPVYDESGTQIGEEKIDREAEKKKGKRRGREWKKRKTPLKKTTRFKKTSLSRPLVLLD